MSEKQYFQNGKLCLPGVEVDCQLNWRFQMVLPKQNHQLRKPSYTRAEGFETSSDACIG